MMMSASTRVFLAVCATIAVMSEGTAFLKAVPKHSADRVSAEDVQTSLLAEIEGSLGTSIASKRVVEMKALLSPIFKSVPKNQHGNLDHVTVRYALHRVFVQRHGWSIKGLDPTGEALNSSSSTGILKDQVPSYIQNMFEQRLGGRGLGLQELSVFAATVEHLIHNEAVGRLGSALSIHNLLPTDSMTSAQANTVLDTYMMAYILGEHLSNMTLKAAESFTQQMPELFLAWSDTQTFVRKIKQEMTAGAPEQISFAMLVKVAETVGEQFGKFQDAECQGLKAALVKKEDRQTGRVRLSDFYKEALDGADGAWQFQESIAYLRQLGALDESNSDEPRVMIPNYLSSQTNCIASSDYYSVCCLSECEDLLGHLEKDIAAPEATASHIVGLISALPSSSVSAPRILSETLLNRLHRIGEEHGGLVQLHSRLFAQWMHHAYPRECPYPHLSGTTSQQQAQDLVNDATATQEELVQFTSVANKVDSDRVEDMHDLMMWSHEEEHLISRPALMPTAPGGSASGLRVVVLSAALVSIVFGLARTSGSSSLAGGKEEKFMV